MLEFTTGVNDKHDGVISTGQREMQTGIVVVNFENS